MSDSRRRVETYLTPVTGALLVAGVFGGLSLGLIRWPSPLSQFPLLRRASVLAALVLSLLGAAIVVTAGLQYVLARDRVATAPTNVAVLATTLATLVYALAIAVAVLSTIDTLVVDAISVLLLLVLGLGYLERYPVHRYRGAGRIPFAIPVLASYVAVAGVFILRGGFDGLFSPVWRIPVGRVGAMAATAIVLHLLASEVLLGLRTGFRHLRSEGGVRGTSVAPAMTLAAFGHVVGTLAVYVRAWSQAPATGILALDWKAYVLTKWIGLAVVVSTIVWVDTRLSDEFAWGPSGSRSDPVVERAGVSLGVALCCVGFLEAIALFVV